MNGVKRGRLLLQTAQVCCQVAAVPQHAVQVGSVTASWLAAQVRFCQVPDQPAPGLAVGAARLGQVHCLAASVPVRERAEDDMPPGADSLPATAAPPLTERSWETAQAEAGVGQGVRAGGSRQQDSCGPCQ